ncbi:hypothetical protein [Shewanella sp. 1180_01]
MQWTSNGFWLHDKRLEQNTFSWLGIHPLKIAELEYSCSVISLLLR